MSRQQSQRQKRIPLRSCVICRQKREKRALTRLVMRPNAGIHIDMTGKHQGRGAYLCPNPACWQKAASSNLLDQALRTALTETDKTLLANHITNLET